jgi:hypothetical protein
LVGLRQSEIPRLKEQARREVDKERNTSEMREEDLRQQIIRLKCQGKQDQEERQIL